MRSGAIKILPEPFFAPMSHRPLQPRSAPNEPKHGEAAEDIYQRCEDFRRAAAQLAAENALLREKARSAEQFEKIASVLRSDNSKLRAENARLRVLAGQLPIAPAVATVHPIPSDTIPARRPTSPVDMPYAYIFGDSPPATRRGVPSIPAAEVNDDDDDDDASFGGEDKENFSPTDGTRAGPTPPLTDKGAERVFRVLCECEVSDAGDWEDSEDENVEPNQQQQQQQHPPVSEGGARNATVMMLAHADVAQAPGALSDQGRAEGGAAAHLPHVPAARTAHDATANNGSGDEGGNSGGGGGASALPAVAPPKPASSPRTAGPPRVVLSLSGSSSTPSSGTPSLTASWDATSRLPGGARAEAIAAPPLAASTTRPDGLSS